MSAGKREVVRIFDTTLRDGEQSPGASMDLPAKLRLAHQLDLLGVYVMEAGFPASSPGDFASVAEIVKEVKRPIIAALARCTPGDITAAGQALKNAKKPRIHVFCATSKVHREKKLKKAFSEIVKISVESIKQALQYVKDVEFSPEDATRTELEALIEIVGRAIEAGATTINIPDTVGYSTPEEYGRIFSLLREKLPVIQERGIVLSAHCHDDLGLAVANSLAAVKNGARQVECTINGIGERAGNASLEEIVMALQVRSDLYHFGTDIDLKEIYPTSRLVEKLSGIIVQRNKAIVGANAFAHEAGIHQDGLLKDRATYEIMNPEDIGLPKSKLVLGKHSGRHAFRERVAALGYTVGQGLNDKVLEGAFQAFKELADKKKSVFDEDIEAILENQLDEGIQPLWQFEQLQFTGGNNAIATATVTLVHQEGRKVTDAATGDGPVDAVYTAIQRILHTEVQLLDYQIQSVTSGKEAQGEVFVKIGHGGQVARGRGVSTDIVEASARAFLSALLRLERDSSRKSEAT